jgi:1-acyl-sn-glycerol-3-phosphate acyltransferase
MIQAFRYVSSFLIYIVITCVWAITAALIGVKQRTVGSYDRSARLWGVGMLQGTGIRVKLEGAEHLDPSRPCVYMSNHASLIDTWAILAVIPGSIRFIYKKGIDYVPLMGRALRAARHLPIHRSSPSKAFATYEQAAKLVREGLSAIVFPEGTRSLDGRLKPFKKGSFVLAIAAGVPVVPIYCHNAYELMPRGSWSPKPGLVTLRVGPPIPTAGLSYDDREQVAAQTRAAILALGARE